MMRAFYRPGPVIPSKNMHTIYLVQSYTIRYYTILSHTIPYHTIRYHTIPYHTIPYHAMPCHTILYRISYPIPYQTTPHRTSYIALKLYTSLVPVGQSECETSPCRNGGTCYSVDDLQSYKCHCPSGFKGMHCEGNVYHMVLYQKNRKKEDTIIQSTFIL